MKQIILIILLGLSFQAKSDEMLNLNLIVAAINTLDLIQTRCTVKILRNVVRYLNINIVMKLIRQ